MYNHMREVERERESSTSLGFLARMGSQKVDCRLMPLLCDVKECGRNTDGHTSEHHPLLKVFPQHIMNVVMTVR